MLPMTCNLLNFALLQSSYIPTARATDLALPGPSDNKIIKGNHISNSIRHPHNGSFSKHNNNKTKDPPDRLD
jgi:hypothetical protein